MRAVTFHGPGRVASESVPDPVLVDPADAIVRVERSAVCGSDLHVYHGRERGLDAGTVMGHEFVGRIVEAGAEAGGLLRAGTVVVSPFTTSCGRCFACREGLSARCSAGQLFGWVQEGRGLQGAQAELVRVPLAATTLVPVPADVPLEHALLLADVLATGHYCAVRGEVAPGSVCAVVGCGPVGLMAVVAALELGAERVWAIDPVPERLEHAARFGAIPLRPDAEDPIEIVRDATDGRGVDAVLELVGSAAAHRTALELVRQGGILSVVGVHNEPVFPFTPAELYDRNVTYRVGRCPARDWMEALVPLVRRRGTELATILTHRLPLSSGPEAYALFDEKREGCVKVVLLP